ncbi:hypothetical protein Tco_1493331 [Tanacetum coccineum]
MKRFFWKSHTLISNHGGTRSRRNGEGSVIPTDPHYIPTIIESTSQPPKKQRSRRPKKKDTQIPQSSVPSDNVANEAVNEEMDDSLVRAVTIGFDLETEQDSGGGPKRQETIGDTIAQTRFENVSKFSNDPFLAKVLALENTKTAQAQEITSLKLRVKKLEKKRGSRTHKLKRLYTVGRSVRIVSSNEASLGDQEDASKHGRKIDDIDIDAEIILVDETQRRYGDDIMFDLSDLAGEEIFVVEQGVLDSKKGNVVSTVVDAAQVSTAATTVTITAEEITLAQALQDLNAAKPKVKGIVFKDPVESTTIVSLQQPSQAKIQDKGKAKMIEPEPVKKLSKKDQLKLDEEVAQRLHAEFDEQERIEREKAKANIALKETWDDIQAKIKADCLLAERLQTREQEELTIEERAKLFHQLLEKRRKHFTTKRVEEKRNRPPIRA